MLHALSEQLDDHPHGRCTTIPKAAWDPCGADEDGSGVGCIQQFWRQVQRLRHDKCFGDHARWTRLCQSTTVQTVRGSGGPFPWATAQAERVQDWPSLDRQEQFRVNLADHAENVTRPLRTGTVTIWDTLTWSIW